MHEKGLWLLPARQEAFVVWQKAKLTIKTWSTLCCQSVLPSKSVRMSLNPTAKISPLQCHLLLFHFPADEVSNLKSSEMLCRELIHLTCWNRQHPTYTAENLGLYLLCFWGLFCIHTTVATIKFCLLLEWIHSILRFTEDFSLNFKWIFVLAGAQHLLLHRFTNLETSLLCL